MDTPPVTAEELLAFHGRMPVAPLVVAGAAHGLAPAEVLDGFARTLARLLG